MSALAEVARQSFSVFPRGNRHKSPFPRVPFGTLTSLIGLIPSKTPVRLAYAKSTAQESFDMKQRAMGEPYRSQSRTKSVLSQKRENREVEDLTNDPSNGHSKCPPMLFAFPTCLRAEPSSFVGKESSSSKAMCQLSIWSLVTKSRTSLPCQGFCS